MGLPWPLFISASEIETNHTGLVFMLFLAKHIMGLTGLIRSRVFLWIIRCIVRSVRSIGDIFLRMTYEKLLNYLFISQKMDFQSIISQNWPFHINLFSLSVRTVWSPAQTRLYMCSNNVAGHRYQVQLWTQSRSPVRAKPPQKGGHRFHITWV